MTSLASVATQTMSEKLTKSEQRERRLNLACTEAKAAAKAAPDDAALAAAYVKAKAAFKKHQQRREQRAEKSAAAAAPAPAASDSWTCAVCGITISVADPRAKEQHLAGKAHAKKAKAAGASEPAKAVPKAGPPGYLAGYWTCKLCGGCTGPSHTRAAHDGGKRHQERLAMLVALAPQLKKGDWVCCSLAPKAHHEGALQHNYASKETCCRQRCGAAQASGLAYAEALRLCRPAAAAVEVADDDITLRCKGCSAEFSFTVAQQKLFAKEGWAKPQRCIECRAKRRAAGGASADVAPPAKKARREANES